MAERRALVETLRDVADRVPPEVLAPPGVRGEP
jgi:hypothetical protein